MHQQNHSIQWASHLSILLVDTSRGLKAMQCNAWHDMTWQGKAWQGMAWQGMAWQGMARQGMARHGKARQGKARQGKARQGKARQGKARQGKARQGGWREGKGRQGTARQWIGSIPCRPSGLHGWGSRRRPSSDRNLDHLHVRVSVNVNHYKPDQVVGQHWSNQNIEKQFSETNGTQQKCFSSSRSDLIQSYQFSKHLFRIGWVYFGIRIQISLMGSFLQWSLYRCSSWIHRVGWQRLCSILPCCMHRTGGSDGAFSLLSSRLRSGYAKLQ